jgi:hypothetical protein
MEIVAQRGLCSWSELRCIPIEAPDPGPARECQWIRDDGRFCGARSVLGRSWCEAHLARVFVSAAAAD